MIARIEGKMIEANPKSVIIDVSGLGYKIFVPTDTFEFVKKHKDEKVALWTYLSVRENAMDLFGFKEKETLEFFELLISISGIGPKTAINILNASTISMLRSAVASGDTAHLTKVSGIGKKTADKIVLELRDKIGELEGDGEHIRGEVDAMEALKSLGYSQSEVREALKKVPKEISGTSEKVKWVLKMLGK